MMTDKMMTERQARAWADRTNDLIARAGRSIPHLKGYIHRLVKVRDVIEEYSYFEGDTRVRIAIQWADPMGELEQWLTSELDLPEGVYVKAEWRY